MNDLLAHIRHLAAVVIFGLVIPTIGFFSIYPGGVSDMVNRFKVESKFRSFKNQSVIEVGQRFTITDVSYWEAMQKLRSAKEGDAIKLVIKENYGGDANVLKMLNDAISQSKAFVVVSVKHFGLSCGTYIAAQGNLFFLSNDSLLLFHTGQHGSGIKTTNKGNSVNDPDNEEAFAMVTKVFEPYTNWITAAERERFKQGDDIYVTGKEICNRVDGRNAPILYRFRDGCVIKGLKDND